MTPEFDKSWTLFLDRDGVINQRIPGSYIKDWEEFQFLNGVLEALAIFNKAFGPILIVTNQQGIGKGIMTKDDLSTVHRQMIHEIEAKRGRIDKAYYCPKLAIDNPLCRKPNSGMALQAQKDFPEIDFSKSLMAGDSLSDIQFACRLGMKTLLIETKLEEKEEIEAAIKSDSTLYLTYRCSGLKAFADLL